MDKIERVKDGLRRCKSYPALCEGCPYYDEPVDSCSPDILLKESLEVIEDLETELKNSIRIMAVDCNENL